MHIKCKKVTLRTQYTANTYKTFTCTVHFKDVETFIGAALNSEGRHPVEISQRAGD